MQENVKPITAIISFGGTRMAYILEENRDRNNPGEIDYPAYLDYCLQKIRNIISYYFQAGGKHLVLEGLDIGLISGDRGDEYARIVSTYMIRLADDMAEFYRSNNADVTFVGIDAIQELPQTHAARRMGEYLATFNETWQYDYGSRRQIIWNVAAIPLYTLYNISATVDNSDIDMLDLVQAEYEIYDRYAKQVYGFHLPMPDMYIGSNTNGDNPLSSRLPVALGVKYHFRSFYVPFPTFFLKQHHFDAIIADLSKKPQHDSYRLDYKGQLSTEAVQYAYEYYSKLAQEKNSITGLFK